MSRVTSILFSIEMIFSIISIAQEHRFKSFEINLYAGYAHNAETSSMSIVKGDFEINNTHVLGLGAAWYLTRHWSVELMASTGQFQAQLKRGDYRSLQILSDEISAGKVWITPISLGIRYHFPLKAQVKPYLAVGRTFTWFNHIDPGWAADAVTYHSRPALHASLGVQKSLHEHWAINAELKHHFTNRHTVEVDFRKSVNSTIEGQLKPDPTNLTISIAYKW